MICLQRGVCAMGFSVCFFFKRKTAYEMRISDWSSDVCSSDLLGLVFRIADRNALHSLFGIAVAGGAGLARRAFDLGPFAFAILHGQHAGIFEIVVLHRLGLGRGDRKSTRLNSSH